MTNAFEDAAGRDLPGEQPRIGPSGHPFPEEREWLDLPAPEGLPIAADFVERTLRALRCDEVVFDVSPAAEVVDDLTPRLLAAHAAPPPSPDFVERTLRLVQRDRRDRWHELLARYVAPEPSPEFVAKTLAALAAGRHTPAAAAARRAWTWPLVTLAAAGLLWFVLRTPARPPIELRLAGAAPVAFAYSHAGTPLPAVLAAEQRAADPQALLDGGPDGAWLLLGRDR